MAANLSGISFVFIGYLFVFKQQIYQFVLIFDRYNEKQLE